jgi:hypothetical protein
MKSKWSGIKEEAARLRKSGKSLNYIGDQFGIPKATLSGWFRGIKLTDEQKAKIREVWIEKIKASRGNAIKWHNKQKEIRLRIASNEASAILDRIDTNSKPILELVLAMLYLGEGSKKHGETSLGSSDPAIARFFIYAVHNCFDIPIERFRCGLNLRADQDPVEMKKYWASQLELPLENIMSASLDKRTL